MRITQATVERLAAEATARSGRIILEGINSPGDGSTRYCMSESSISVYKTARVAAAYLLGVLSGLHPAGHVKWIEDRPEWVAKIDAEFEYGQIGAAALAAHTAGTEYGRTHRPADRLERIRESLRRQNISYGELHELQAMTRFIDPGDLELLEAAGVPEHNSDSETR